MERCGFYGALRGLTDCLRVHASESFDPIAEDLYATEGMAGQAISVSGLFAVLTSLLIATIATRKTFFRNYRTDAG